MRSWSSTASDRVVVPHGPAFGTSCSPAPPPSEGHFVQALEFVQALRKPTSLYRKLGSCHYSRTKKRLDDLAMLFMEVRNVWQEVARHELEEGGEVKVSMRV